MSLIVASGLTKTYTKGSVSVEALKDLTFTIDRASFVSFIGPSGSGKTTLLNLIGALDRPTSGLWSNLELHGEWTHIPRAVTLILGPTGAIEQREHPATSLVVGLRYLTEKNTTFIADYYRNGNGYTSEEIETFFDFVDRAHDSFTTTGDDQLLTLARRASEAGYGRINPGRNYVYGRVTQPDALGVLYLTLGASAVVNADDGAIHCCRRCSTRRRKTSSCDGW